MRSTAILSVYVLSLLLIVGIASAADCYCDSCSNCTEQLNSPSCDRVLVSSDINIPSGYCLNNPANFSGKTFDCQGYTLSGSGVNGIYLRNKSNILIDNCYVNLTGFSGSALSIDQYFGDSTSNVTVNNCTFAANSNAVTLQYAGGVTIQNSNLWSNNGYDFFINPSSTSCTHVLDNVTHFGGAPIIYSNESLNLSNAVVSELVLCGASNSNIENLTVSNDRQVNGVLLAGVRDSTFNNITMSTGDSGIRFAGGTNTNVTINNSVLSGVKNPGIIADTYPSVSNSNILNTRIYSQYSNGIQFRDVGATGININNVTIQSQSTGIYFRNFGTAITANMSNVTVLRSPLWLSSGGISVEGGTFRIFDSLLNQSSGDGIFAERSVLFVDNTRIFSNAKNDINLSNSVLTATDVLFDYSNDVSLQGEDVVLSSAQFSEVGESEPLGYSNIGRAVKTQNNSGSAWLFLNITYSESELSGSEAYLNVLKHNSSGWSNLTGSGIDTTNNFVYSGNQSDFSYFVPLEQQQFCGGAYGSCECGETVYDDYTMTGNLDCNGSALNFGASDVTLNCNGFSLAGNGSGYGIYASGFSGLTINNCKVSNFSTGVYFDNVDNSLIFGGEIKFNNPEWDGNGGIYFRAGSTGNTISAIYLHENNDVAVFLDTNSNNTIVENSVIDNNGGDSREILVLESSGLTIQNNNVTSGSGYGIEFRYVYNSMIKNNNITDNSWEGIYLYQSSSVTVSNNAVLDNNQGGVHEISGISVIDSNSNVLQGNTVRCTPAGLSYDGIRIVSSMGPAENNQLSGNNISRCEYGLNANGISYFSAGNEQYYENIVGAYLVGVGYDESAMPQITNSNMHDNRDGISVISNSIAYVENTDFTDNQEITSGLDVDSSSQVYLVNGNFDGNAAFGISALGAVYWTLSEDVDCTNNDISIAGGFIVPLGGKINASSCTISVNGDTFNTSGGQTGSYKIEVNESANNTFGGSSYGAQGEIHTLSGNYSGNITVNFYSENPGGSGFYLAEFGLWIDASIDPVPSDLDWWILKIYYTDEDLAASGLSESSLQLQFYNATSGTWYVEPNQGVDAVNNYVWANLSHFSVYGLYGSSGGSGLSSGGGGGRNSVYSMGTLSTSTPLNLKLLRLQKYNFLFRGKAHSITLKTLLDTSATFTLASWPQDVSVNVGESKSVDVNGDSVADIRLTLVRLTRFDAEVRLEELIPAIAPASAAETPVAESEPEQVSEVKQVTESEYVPEQRVIDTGYPPIPYQKKSKFAWLAWPVLIALIAVAAVYFLVLGRKSGRKH